MVITFTCAKYFLFLEKAQILTPISWIAKLVRDMLVLFSCISDGNYNSDKSDNFDIFYNFE